MITCKKCKKFAKITRVIANKFTEKIGVVYGSCKHCGYKNKPNLVEYDDFDELGIEF